MTAASRQSVRVVTESIIRQYLLGTDIPSVSERLFQAQWCFVSSNGLRAGISDRAIAPGVNTLARVFEIPHYSEVNEAQIEVLRNLWMPLAPTLLGPPQNETRGDSHLMSPAGAALLGLGLIQQKISNPLFQQSSEKFIKAVERMKSSGDTSIKVRVTTTKQPVGSEPPDNAILTRLAAELHTSPELQRDVVRFFDAIGASCSISTNP
jgi:hypothetical protein